MLIYMKSLSLLRSGKYEEAASGFKEVLERDPSNSEALAHLSTACFKRDFTKRPLRYLIGFSRRIRREKQSFSEKGLALKALGEYQGGFSYL